MYSPCSVAASASSATTSGGGGALARREPERRIDLFGSVGDHSVSCFLKGWGDILFLSWNETENHLIAVLENGPIHFFSASGNSAAPTIYIELLPRLFATTRNGIVGVSRANGSLQLVLVEYSGESREYVVKLIDAPHLAKTTVNSAVFVVQTILTSLDGTTSLSSSAAGTCTKVFTIYPAQGTGEAQKDDDADNTSSVSCCIFNANSPPTWRHYDVVLPGVVKKAAIPAWCTGRPVVPLAFLTDDGSVYLTDTDLEEAVLLHVGKNLPSLSSSSSLWSRFSTPFLFCGEAALLLGEINTEQGALGDEDQLDSNPINYFLISVDGASEVEITDEMPSRVAFFFDECDGIRVISRESLCFLQVVPPEARRLFDVGSLAPGAVLYSAFGEFSAGNAAALGMLQRLQQNPAQLLNAISDCIRTAAFEWEPAARKYLLRSAAFGKSFCLEGYDPDLFVTVTKELRVLHALQNGRACRMILSHAELRHIGEQKLIQRLVRCGYHSEAWVMCDALKCMSDDIRSDWTLSKLQYDMDRGKSEEDSARELVEFITKANDSSAGTIPFTELASMARFHGKGKAALIFLASEPIAIRQVPMLLVFGEAEKALEKAIATSDSDLLFTVVQYLLRTGGPTERQLITTHPDSRNLLLVYISACPHYRHLVREFFQAYPTVEQYLQARDFLQLQQQLTEKLTTDDGEDKSLEFLCNNFQKPKEEMARRFTSEKKSSSSSSSGPGGRGATGPVSGISIGAANTAGNNASGTTLTLTDRYLRLQSGIVERQTQLALEYRDERFLTASVSDMIYLLFEHQGTRSDQVCEEAALAIRQTYNVGEDMFQWCRLKAFAATEQWEQVDRMGGIGTRQKAVLSGESIVSLLLSYNRPQQAAKHISHIPKIEERLEYYVQCGDWAEAGRDCRRAGNTDLFGQLKARAKGNVAALEQIQHGWDATSTTGITFGNLFS